MKRGQSVVEYALLFVGVVGALLAGRNYLRNSVQGNVRERADQIGQQFSWQSRGTERRRSATLRETASGLHYFDPETGETDRRRRPGDRDRKGDAFYSRSQIKEGDGLGRESGTFVPDRLALLHRAYKTEFSDSFYVDDFQTGKHPHSFYNLNGAIKGHTGSRGSFRIGSEGSGGGNGDSGGDAEKCRARGGFWREGPGGVWYCYFPTDPK